MLDFCGTDLEAAAQEWSTVRISDGSAADVWLGLERPLLELKGSSAEQAPMVTTRTVEDIGRGGDDDG